MGKARKGEELRKPVRQNQPRKAKTKCANVPNLYVDQVLDSPRELRSQGGKCAYRVPITLHPHSPGLHSAFFPCGTLPGSQVKSVSGPSLMALRELQQHPHKAEELRMSVARHEGPEYELLVLGGEAGGLGRQSYSSGHVKCETEAGGHIVPIVVVPSLACIGKEGKHTSPKHEHGYKPQGCFPSFVSPSSDAKHLDPVQSSQALCGGFPLRNSPCSPGIQGVSVVSHEIEADQSSIDQRLSTRSPGTTQQGLPDAQSSENSSRAASSKLSETESESLINDSGNTNRELPMHPHGQTVMGKDGIYCCGGVRQVPASGPGALLPLVDIPGPGSLAAKHCEEVWCSHVNLRTSNPGVTESEETRTASIHSASHRNQVQDTASGKSLLLTKQQPQLHAPRHTDIQIPSSTDKVTERLIRLDISLNVAQKCFDIRQLMVILDFLLHFPIQFKTLKGSAIGETVNKLRNHKHPDVAKSASILVRVWRWAGAQHLKQSSIAKTKSKSQGVQKTGLKNRTKMARSSKRVARNARELTTIVHQLESVMRDL